MRKQSWFATLASLGLWIAAGACRTAPEGASVLPDTQQQDLGDTPLSARSPGPLDSASARSDTSAAPLELAAAAALNGAQSDAAGVALAEPGPKFNPCASAVPCAILPFGDSITAGTGSTDGGGYRVELFRQAVAHHQALSFVGRSRSGPTEVAGQAFPRQHEGHSGYLIDTGPTRPGLLPIVDAVFAAVTPNIVLLMIGTNDIPWNLDLPNEPRRLGILIDQIISRAPDALVVVAQIGPTAIPERTALVEAYNAGIPAVVAARVAAGKHVQLVDLFTPFTSNPNYSSELLKDEVHPNDAGHVVLGQHWYAAIAPYLPAAP